MVRRAVILFLLVVVLAPATLRGAVGSSNANVLGDMKSCECWKLEECPSNCTGKEVRGILVDHNRLFERIKRPFVILFPWFERGRRPAGSDAKKCGQFAASRQLWISLPNQRQVRVLLRHSGTIVDASGLKVLAYDRGGEITAVRSDMDARKFNTYRLGSLKEKGRTIPNSYVAVDACRGLRGVLSDGVRSYIVRPLSRKRMSRSGGRRPHVIYEAPEPVFERSLRSKTFWMHQLPDTGSLLVNVSSRRLVLNLAVLVDAKLIERFNWKDDQLSKCGYYVARLINMATKAFRGTPIEIRLRSMVMMSSQQLRTNKDIKDTLNQLVRFLSKNVQPWKRQLGWPANATLLLTTQAFEEAVEYLAVPASMCLGPNRTVGVVQVMELSDEYRVSKLIALAIADMFGVRGFPCPKGRTCQSGEVLSDGDKKRLHNTIMSGIAKCLETIPARKWMMREPVNLCGNGIVDRGEECDSPTSRCCLPDVCLARAGVQCLDSGIGSACCRDCRLRPAGDVCRAPVSECDLPELCDGRRGVCPRDLALEDGQPCAGGRAFCFRGRCPTLDGQCREVWGPAARSANRVCYRQINTQKGHCGDRRKCNRVRDTTCGVLHCEGGAARPIHGDDFWHTTNPSDNGTTECKYLKESAPPKRRFVADGTKCEGDRLCRSAECKPVAQVFSSACPAKCSQRGVCLSAGRCLCRPGWGGRRCERRVPVREGTTGHLLLKLQWRHLDSSGVGPSNASAWPSPNGGGGSSGVGGPLNTITLIIILGSVIGGGAFLLVVIFMLCYRRRSSHRQRSAAAGNGDALWTNKRPGYSLPKDQLHMDYTADGVERRKRKRKRRGRQRRNSRGKIIGSRYGENDYVDENDSMERIIKFGSMPSYREDKLNKMLDGNQPAMTGFSSLKTGVGAGGAPGASFGSSGSESGSQGRQIGAVCPTGNSLTRNALSSPSSGAGGSPADVYAAMLGSGSSVSALPGRNATPPMSGPCEALSEGRHPEKGILKNKNIGDLQELANLLSDKVRHSMGPPVSSELQTAPNVVDLPPCTAAPTLVGAGPVAHAPSGSGGPSGMGPATFQEKTNAISGSSCTSDDDSSSSSCSSVSSTGTAVQPPVILCNAGQQTEPVPTDDSEGEEGSCVTGGEGMSEPEVDQDFLKEEVKSTEGTCWDSAEEELTDGEELLPRSVIRSAELLEDFAQKIPSTNLLLRSLQQQQQHKPLYRDKAPLHQQQMPLPPVHLHHSGSGGGGAMAAVPPIPTAMVVAMDLPPVETEREATRRKRQSYTRATESYESLPPATGSCNGAGSGGE